MSCKKARSLGLQHIRVGMGLFEFDVVFLTGEYDAAVKYVSWLCEEPDLEKYDLDVNNGYAPRGKCFYRPGYVPVVWIPERPQTPRQYGTFTHECVHAVRHMFDWAGIPTDDSTEEVYAHSVAHLVNGYLEKVK